MYEIDLHDIWRVHSGYNIQSAELQAHTVRLSFEGGHLVVLQDVADYCCERRYAHSDDDFRELEGRPLVSVDLKDGPDTEGPYAGYKECAFLEITAGSAGDMRTVTVACYNEHNGYYGGFEIEAHTTKRR